MSQNQIIPETLVSIRCVYDNIIQHTSPIKDIDGIILEHALDKSLISQIANKIRWTSKTTAYSLISVKTDKGLQLSTLWELCGPLYPRPILGVLASEHFDLPTPLCTIKGGTFMIEYHYVLDRPIPLEPLSKEFTRTLKTSAVGVFRSPWFYYHSMLEIPLPENALVLGRVHLYDNIDFGDGPSRTKRSDN